MVYQLTMWSKTISLSVIVYSTGKKVGKVILQFLLKLYQV
jgi:hypothetical protein